MRPLWRDGQDPIFGLGLAIGFGLVAPIQTTAQTGKDPEDCQRHSGFGFGTRVMPRFGLEIGYRVSPDAFISLLYDLMSHKGIIGGENEGIDHIGLRYNRPY